MSSFDQALDESQELKELKEIQSRPYLLSDRSLLEKARFFWQLKMRGISFLVLSLFATVASLLIVFGELAILFEIKTNMLPKLVRNDLGFFFANVSF